MDPFLYISAAIIVAIILFIVSRLRSFHEVESPSSIEEVVDRPITRTGPAARIGGESGPRRRVQARMRASRQQQYSDEEDEEDELETKIALPDGKIGAKKRQKLEMKAEKKLAREAEEAERADKKKREALMEEERKKADERQKQDELQKELEEKARREEEEKREHEEYLKLKESFTVENEGFSGNQTEEESQSLLQEFVNYVKATKVVILEDLASQFHLKTQDVIDRIQKLQDMGILMGVIDDRGKFICLSMDELQAVATFIKRRGRVSISELAENSNALINLQSSIVPQIVAV